MLILPNFGGRGYARDYNERRSFVGRELYSCAGAHGPEVSLETSLLDQGVTLMLVGMGTVFVFLTVLVAGMSLMSSIVMRFTPVLTDGASEEEVVAITAAITQHRNNSAK